MKLKALVLSSALSLLLSGCTAMLFDSSVGSEGEHVIITDGKLNSTPVTNTRKSRVHKKTEIREQGFKTTETKSKSGTLLPVGANNNDKNNLGLGVVKPYVPDDSDNVKTFSNLGANKDSNKFSELNQNQQEQNTKPLSLSPAGTPVTVETEVETIEAQNYEQNIDDAYELPTYASSSLLNSNCDFDKNNAYTIARNLSLSLAKRLLNEQGAMYVAPTVISDEYSDCLNDLSSIVAQGMAANGNFEISTVNVGAGQNAGSSTLIPALVRACRSNQIPYLNVTVVRKTASKPSLSMRVIRVKDGITLAQQTQSLK